MGEAADVSAGKRAWWKPVPNARPTTMGFARYLYVMGLAFGWVLHWLVGGV